MISKGDLCGIILVGGKSSRMGMPKHGLIYHNDNQVNYSVALLKSFCHDIFISCSHEQAISQNFPTEIVEDNPHYSDSGPIAGVLSALEKTNSAVLVIGCDYPFLQKQDIAQLISERKKDTIATVFENPIDKLPEPLIGIYERTSLPKLQINFWSGKYSVRKFLQENNAHLLSIHNIEAIKSIDTLAEYELTRKSIHHKTLIS